MLFWKVYFDIKLLILFEIQSFVDPFRSLYNNFELKSSYTYLTWIYQMQWKTKQYRIRGYCTCSKQTFKFYIHVSYSLHLFSHLSKSKKEENKPIKLTNTEFTRIHTVIFCPRFVCCTCGLSIVLAIIQFINTTWTKYYKH